MNTRLADDPAQAVSTEQRLSQRAAVAVALAPVFVLLALTLVIGDLIAADTGFAVVAASIAWLVYEMHQYQRAIPSGDDIATVLDALADGN